MDISDAIIQGLIKEAGSPVVEESFRDMPSVVDERMTRLGNELLKIYGSLTNNYGCFDRDAVTYPFSTNLRSYVDGATPLVAFSKATARLISASMRLSLASTGGYVVLLRYRHLERDWLLIVMLKLKSRTGIDPANLELNDSLSFDIDHLHEAARIDLEKWRADQQPYLSFIKRSGRKDEVTKYFRLALGCTDYTDSRSHTECVIKAVTEYGEDQQWSQERRSEARKKLYEHFAEKSKSKTPVNLVALSAIIDDQEPAAFLNFTRARDHQINETFEPHKKTYQKLFRVTEKFGSISLGFDVQDIVDGTIDLDDDNDIIIRNPPQTLIEKIKKERDADAIAE